jgi:hypothetical protein
MCPELHDASVFSIGVSLFMHAVLKVGSVSVLAGRLGLFSNYLFIFCSHDVCLFVCLFVCLRVS